MIEPRAKLNDIDKSSLDKYLERAKETGRLPSFKSLSMLELLEKLRVVENGKLKRSSIILFGKDPGKFFPNICVKIGRFMKNDFDIKFQEVEEGNLISMLESVLDQLNRKFFISPIEFHGINRIEKNEYPIIAIREMLLNALVHRNYFGASTQIRVYDDKMSIWNDGFLPESISLESLKSNHASKPRNPIIADVCFKGGYIDLWGRGTLKIVESCLSSELAEPEFSELSGGFLVTIYKNIYTEEHLVKIGLNPRQVKTILYVKEKGSITNNEYQELINVSKATATRDIRILLEKNIFINQGTKGSSAVYRLK